MNKPLFAAVFILTSAISSGCAVHRPNLPWRTVDPITTRTANPEKCVGNIPLPNRIALDQLADDRIRKAMRCTSTERFKDGDFDTEFDLHVVEFDDQGLFWNRQQAEKALLDIAEVRKRSDVLVFVFFHGWFNNADVCNGKLACFRELLSLMAEAERADYRSKLEEFIPGASGTPRRVIGVYGGWRGETLAIEGLKGVTFWGRKSTAHTVGENGAVTELIAGLARIVHPQSNVDEPPAGPPAKPDLSSLIAVGHSFGGALLMSAIGNELNRAAGEALTPGGPAPRVVSRMADLTVLVNPAVEASRFDNVRRAANEATFSDEQTPILLTLSSEADTPNKILFPIGQALAFAQKAARSREQWQGMIQSLGTFRANHTHQLIAAGKAPSNGVRTAKCVCDSGIAEYRDVLLSDLLKGLQEEKGRDLTGSAADPAHGRRRDYRYSRLEPMQDTDPNSPFMMVQVDDDVIGGHSDIFNPRIVDFLLEFVVRSEAKTRLVRTRRAMPARRRFVQPQLAPAAVRQESCFDVTRSPDGPVSIVKLATNLTRKPRRINIERSPKNGQALTIERSLDENEREFPFNFTVSEATYKLSLPESPGDLCAPLEYRVPPEGERTPPFGHSAFIGLADGLGGQVGGSLSIKRLSFETSIIKSAGSHDARFTMDYAIGVRSKRGLAGIGVRERHEVADDVPFMIGYFHYTLELPGVRLLGKTWSSWMGLEVRPLAKSRADRTWAGQFDLGVRLQIRLPRERWFNGS